MNPVLSKLIQRQNLEAHEAEAFLSDMLAGNIPPVQLAAVLCALRMKGESDGEILGFVRAMRGRMRTINTNDAIDVCGTGGDQAGTFNISTTVAFVVAGAGAKVAKHGNRAVSSQCGSADVLEALGIPIDLTPRQAEKVLRQAGMVFLFAPRYHPAMKRVAPVRKALGIPTIFNLLGPFANPAGVTRQLVGVSDIHAAEKLSKVALQLPYTRLLIVTSQDGLDEISLSGPTKVFEVHGGKVKKYTVSAQQYGFREAMPDDIRGGDAAANAQIITDILDGQKGAKTDIVLLNSGFALYAAQLASTPEEGIELARRSIGSGAAKAVLARYKLEANRNA